MSHAGKAVKAKPRQRMIEVKVRFWTDDLAGKEGYVLPKHAWTTGVVRMESNETHGIIPSASIHFNSLMEIPSTIEKVLIKHGIKLHLYRNMDNYIEK
jgi:hypothetical protein